MALVALPRLLFIEDDRSLREAVTVSLRGAGFEVQAEPDGSRLADAVAMFHPDLAILDVRLPDDEDGFELAVRLRTMAEIPIVFVTAADAIDDRLRGFEVGADDYIVKPFDLDELLARLRALLRRTSTSEETLRVADVTLDPATRQVSRCGQPIDLTKTEFDLLELLMSNAGLVLSRSQIYEKVWDYDFGPSSNSLEVYIGYLRRKLGEPRLINTVRGVGYVIREPK